MQRALQDAYLNILRKEKIVATIHLVNGFQLRVQVISFDNFIVIVNSEGRQMMIYKHAISTITPATPVDVFALSQEE